MTVFDERVDGLTEDVTAGPALDFETAAALVELTDHLHRFVGRLAREPHCPSSRPGDRVETVVTAYSLADDSAVHDALDRFETLDKDVLLVVHPDAAGLRYFDLFDLRARLADELLGRYEVFSGHPEDPFTRAGVACREALPVLHLVRADRLIEAECRLSPRRPVPAPCGP